MESAHRKRPAARKAPTRRPGIWVLLLSAALLLSMLVSLGLGSADVGIGDALRILGTKLHLYSPEKHDVDEIIPAADVGSTPEQGVILQIRLPRVVLAVLIGMLLAISGVVMQAFFRNVMAGPYLVGVSSGAALGAVLAMILGWAFSIGKLSTVPLSAFVFALAVVALVYVLNRRRGKLQTDGLLLTGIAVASAISAVVAVLMVMSSRSVHQVLFWLLGSLSAARWDHVEVVLPYAVVGVVVVLFLARDMDLLLWGDVTGAALGVQVDRTRTILLVAASLMTASAVAVSGVIGFVGLMVPHVARFLVGAMHRRLIVVSALLGGLLLLWADVLARTLWAPTELPLGAITAIVGAPFLVYLCTRGRVAGR
ncbi:FecCD family ABC transporter permease [Candidatus Eisenbacteria bacterium]|uniref:FecCD family ABC transporter permease n=1 Tax=Eiseniibacteriota bacterium TaxID=2212470 RepID=A0ABV6YIR4_UNCEI